MDKLVYTQIIKPDGYREYRLAELVKWCLDTRRKPDDARIDIRNFFDYYLLFMKWDWENYGVKSVFENEQILFRRDGEKELWAKIDLQSFSKDQEE